MNRISQYNLSDWVSYASDDNEREWRAAVHTILMAISDDPDLRGKMIIKGGILMALRYQSPRYTKDIDFSTSLKLIEINVDEIKQRLNTALLLAVDALEYEIDCRIQRWKIQPANHPEASFPSITISIGYAPKGTAKHKRLLDLKSPSTISLDFSLNEAVGGTEAVQISPGHTIEAYNFADLMAEKFRSLLQQVSRNRYRRQDVYDLFMLSRFEITEVERQQILASLLKKSQSRDLEPSPASLRDPEVKRRAEKDYNTLEDEVEGTLPLFESAYAAVLAFYESLPWKPQK